MKSFIENLAEAIEVADVSKLTSETKFKELPEWSSLAALIIIAFADENYDVEISGKEIREATTIQDLYNIINNKK